MWAQTAPCTLLYKHYAWHHGCAMHVQAMGRAQHARACAEQRMLGTHGTCGTSTASALMPVPLCTDQALLMQLTVASLARRGSLGSACLARTSAASTPLPRLASLPIGRTDTFTMTIRATSLCTSPCGCARRWLRSATGMSSMTRHLRQWSTGSDRSSRTRSKRARRRCASSWTASRCACSGAMHNAPKSPERCLCMLHCCCGAL